MAAAAANASPSTAALPLLPPTEQPPQPKLFDVACTLSRSHSARYSYGRNCPVSQDQDVQQKMERN